MAAFLARLYQQLNGAPAPIVATPFTDIPTDSFAANDIARIYGLGITTGTTETTYDPKTPVTREQMASFLARLYEQLSGQPAPVVATPFTDVPADSFAANDIARIFGLGITTGTTPTTYNPNTNITRTQMASFLARLYQKLSGEASPVVEVTPSTDVAADSFAAAEVGTHLRTRHHHRHPHHHILPPGNSHPRPHGLL